jgi:hypothetical protein
VFLSQEIPDMTSDHACFGVPQSHFAQNQTGSDPNDPMEPSGSDLHAVEHERSKTSDTTIGHAGNRQDVETDPAAISRNGSIPNHRLRSTPLTPQTWQEAEKLAKLLCKSKLVPQGFESPDLCLIAILQGLEMGLPPMMALQRMALVEGKLTLWGDGALALVLKSGLCPSITEWMGLTGHIGESQSKSDQVTDRIVCERDLIFDPSAQKREDDWIAFCEVTRAGWDKPIRRSFSTYDAKRANLWKKEGPWADYPKRMLQMRARAFALRDAFADVLGGLYLREEIEPRDKRANASPIKGTTTRNYWPKNPAVKTSDPAYPDPDNFSGHPPTIGKKDKSISDETMQEEDVASEKCRGTNELHRQQKAAIYSKRELSKRLENLSYTPPISHQSLIWTDSKPLIAERRRAPAPPSDIMNANKAPNLENTQKVNEKPQDSRKDCEKTTKSAQNNSDSSQDGLILQEFTRSLRTCLNLADLDACRIKFQPSLDHLAPESLDRAAQLYLEQEARIETETTPQPKLQNTKKRRSHPQIRRWKAQYRPYQNQKRQKHPHKSGFEQENSSNEGPD